MKTTNLEEMRIAMETYYEEVRCAGQRGGGRAPCWAAGRRAGTELGAPSGRGPALAPRGGSSPGGPELRSWSLLLLQAQWKDEVRPLSFRFRL